MAGSLGLEFALSTAVGLYLGYVLDRKLGWRPIFFTIVLGMLGAAGGMILVLKNVRRLARPDPPNHRS